MISGSPLPEQAGPRWRFRSRWSRLMAHRRAQRRSRPTKTLGETHAIAPREEPNNPLREPATAIRPHQPRVAKVEIVSDIAPQRELCSIRWALPFLSKVRRTSL